MRFIFSSIFAVSLILGAPSSLLDAVKSKNRPAVREFIQQHVDINAPEVDGTTPLHWAVYQDDPEMTGLLIRAGAHVKAVNRYGVTALSLACTNGNAAIVELLMSGGADANTTLPGGETALMTASRSGSITVVEALISRGANIHAKETRHGQTALMWAAAEGHADVVKALIQAGASFRERLEPGYTPFFFAVREGHIDVVQALLKAGEDVNATIQAAPTKSGLASGAGFPKPGTSALILAVINGHFSLAAALLDAGANPNAIGPGYTALHAVSWVRKPGGGDNDPAPLGSGSMTSIQFVKKLVSHGADVNARMTRPIKVGLTGLNTLGATPFLLAARTADAELMRTLAELGADPVLPNADNASPLIVAAGLGTRSPGEDAGTESEVLEAVQVALDLGNNLNAVDNNGETVMHGAAYKNLPAVVQLLAGKGAKVEIWNQKNKQGWTPVTIAEGHRFGNYKPSPETVAAFRRIMTAAGVSPSELPAVSGVNSDYKKIH